MGKIVKLLFVVWLVSFVVFVGCKKDEPVAEDHTGHGHAMGEMDEAVETADAVVAAVVEQTTCPVMGGKINKKIFTEYKGKKVYFCCAGCDSKFKADPEKYLSKLPQFAE
jgi:YHS domain-containing protein